MLRKLIAQEVPRHETQRQMGDLQGEITALQSEQQRVELTLQRRRKQLALLFHCIEELQALPAEEEAGGGGGGGGAAAQPMQED